MSSLRRRRRAPVKTARRRPGRRLFAEPLEDRRLLAVNPLHNEVRPFDTSGDGEVSPVDALVVIDHLNTQFATARSSASAAAAGEAEAETARQLDVNNDHVVSSRDALNVINFLNGEGENGATTRYIARIFDSSGTQEISTIGVGGSFQLKLFVQDVRMTGDRVGVATAYADVRYETGFLTPVPHDGTDRHPDPFIDDRDPAQFGGFGLYSSVPLGDIPRDGLIDLAGGTDRNLLNCTGVAGDPFCPGAGEVLMWTVNFTADQVGTVTFAAEPTTDVLTDPDDVDENGPQSPTGDTNRYNVGQPDCPAFNPSFEPPRLECTGEVGFQSATLTIAEDIAAVDDAFTVSEDSLASNPNNDLDVINNPTGTDILNSGTGIFLESFTQPPDGTVTRNDHGTSGDTSDDTLIYVPDGNFFTGTSPDEFTYTINNNAGIQSTATVRITVTPSNDAPVNTVPGTRTIAEDEVVTFTNAFSVSDADNNVQGEIDVRVTLSTTAGGTLDVADSSIVSNDNSTSVVIEGPLSQVNTALGTVQFTPLANSSTNDSIVMLTNDLGNVGGPAVPVQSTVDITINAENDLPEITVPGSQTVFFVNTLTFAPPLNAITVNDVDNSNLTVTLSVPSGTLTATQDGAAITGNGTGNVQIEGTIQQINNALDGLVFDPVDNVVDTVVLTVTADDGVAANGEGESSSETVTIQVIPPTSPFAINDEETISEGDGTNTINIDVLKRGQPGADLEPDGGTNDVLRITQPPAGQGTAVLLADNSIDYTAPADFFGTVTFTYTINAFDDQVPPNAVGDGESTGNVSVDVTPLNDQPQISVPSSPTVDEGGEFDFGSTLTVSDADAPFDADYSAQLTLSVSNGELEATPSGANIQNNNSGTVVITGTIDQLNNALNGLKYRPLGVLGTDDTLNISMDDLGNEGNGGEPHTNQVSLPIDVRAQNNDPTASVPSTPQSFITNVDNILSNANNNAIQVDDVDAAGNDIRVVVTSSDPQATFSVTDSSLVPDGSNGTNQLTLLGSVSQINNALGTGGLNFRTPNAGQPTIIVTVNDLGNTGEGGGEDVVESFQVEVLDFVGSEIGGRVFLEGPLERGIEGVAVRLVGQDFRDQPVDITVFTDRNGRYSFRDIRPGSYTLDETQPQHVQDGQDALTAILTADGDGNNDRGQVTIGIQGGLSSLNNDFGERGLSANFAGVLNELLASHYQLDGILFGSGGWAIFLGASWDNYSHGRMTLDSTGQSASVTANNGVSDRTATVYESSARLRVFRGSSSDEHVTLIRGTPAEIFGGSGEGESSGGFAQFQPDEQATQRYQEDVDRIMQEHSVA